MSGILAMQTLAYRQLSVMLDDDRALTLWEEVKTELIQRGMENTMREVESSTTDNLDTLLRGGVLLVFAVIMTQRNGDPKGDADLLNRLVSTLSSLDVNSWLLIDDQTTSC